VLVLEERVLDAEGFRVILSDARIKIMKCLRERDKTIPELGGELGFSETAVRHHLQKLSASGFVKKKDSSRKWVYFQLTPEGKKIVSEEPKKIILIFCLLAVLAVSSFFALFWLSNFISPPRVVPSAGPSDGSPAQLQPGVVLSASSVFSSDEMDVLDNALDAAVAYSERGSNGLE